MELAPTFAAKKLDSLKVWKENPESQDLNHHSQPTVVSLTAQPPSPMSKLLPSAQPSSEEEAHGLLLSEGPTTEEPNFSVFLDMLTIHALSKKKCQFL
jgi:hypothetical protein